MLPLGSGGLLRRDDAATQYLRVATALIEAAQSLQGRSGTLERAGWERLNAESVHLERACTQLRMITGLSAQAGPVPTGRGARWEWKGPQMGSTRSGPSPALGVSQEQFVRERIVQAGLEGRSVGRAAARAGARWGRIHQSAGMSRDEIRALIELVSARALEPSPTWSVAVVRGARRGWADRESLVRNRLGRAWDPGEFNWPWRARTLSLPEEGAHPEIQRALREACGLPRVQWSGDRNESRTLILPSASAKLLARSGSQTIAELEAELTPALAGEHGAAVAQLSCELAGERVRGELSAQARWQQATRVAWAAVAGRSG